MNGPASDRDKIKPPGLVGTGTKDIHAGSRCYFFAGGGTGGHIYPAIGVAEYIRDNQPGSAISFFCSCRPIDSQILSPTGFDFVTLPAKGFSLRPDRLISFAVSLLKSYRLAKTILTPVRKRAVVVSLGGFVSAPVVLAANKLDIPIAMLNVDFLPGRANRLLGRFAKRIFVQFPETEKFFPKTKAAVRLVGCPLRKAFMEADKKRAVDDLGLDPDKKVLLITGASSGSANINNAVCELLDYLADFADTWQIVHITGKDNLAHVQAGFRNAKIEHKLLDYYDDMPDLLAAADLIVARAGAVSIAEYAAAGAPAICLPYPYHKDRHQYKNASKLAGAGAAVIVRDTKDTEQTAKILCKNLINLMQDDQKLRQMARAAKNMANLNAAEAIARELTYL